jgi:hypothetical protein
MIIIHRYRKKKNRLLKVCYVPATSARLPRLLFLFLIQPLTVLMEQTRQAGCAIKLSILLKCLCNNTINIKKLQMQKVNFKLYNIFHQKQYHWAKRITRSFVNVNLKFRTSILRKTYDYFQDVPASTAVDSWYNEVKLYTYGSGFSSETGHFTQGIKWCH